MITNQIIFCTFSTLSSTFFWISQCNDLITFWLQTRVKKRTIVENFIIFNTKLLL